MYDKKEIVIKYIKLVENLSTSFSEFYNLLHPDIIITEFPNLITKHVNNRNIEDIQAGLKSARKLLKSQKYDIQNIMESGNNYVIVEAVWKGEIMVDAGHIKKNQVLTANICLVFEIKDGRIYRQRNYDCYEPF